MGNLNYRTTKEELSAAMAEAGDVQDVFLPLDRATGRPRGFAFVQFDSDEEAEKAIELFNGRELGGRPLKVNMAEDRPQRGSRPPRFDGPRRYDQGRGSGDGGQQFGGDFPFEGERGGFNDFGGKPTRAKGSRRGLRGKKRSL